MHKTSCPTAIWFAVVYQALAPDSQFWRNERASHPDQKVVTYQYQDAFSWEVALLTASESLLHQFIPCFTRSEWTEECGWWIRESCSFVAGCIPQTRHLPPLLKPVQIVELCGLFPYSFFVYPSLQNHWELLSSSALVQCKPISSFQFHFDWRRLNSRHYYLFKQFRDCFSLFDCVHDLRPSSSDRFYCNFKVKELFK